MMRSMYSGVSGLKVHQTRMDVIGNNIANVNTTGYKSQRVTFSDVFSQTLSSASSASDDTGRGGTNPMQVGLGVNISSIDMLMTEGATERTDNPFDVMVKGNGFIVVGDNNGTYFTRAGALRRDDDGNLITANGLKVQGWGTQYNSTTGKYEVVKGQLSGINLDDPTLKSSKPSATTSSTISGNLNSTSTSKEPTQLTFYDSLGNSYSLPVEFQHKSTATDGKTTWTIDVTKAADGKTYMTDTDGNKYEIAFTGLPQDIVFGTDGKLDTSSATAVSSLTFDLGDGKVFASTDGKVTSGTFGAAGKIKVDFASLTQYASKSTLKAKEVDGGAAGKMVDYALGTDGIVTAVYDNGSTRPIAQIVVAEFDNPEGLEKVGENLYQATTNSGDFDGVGTAGSFYTGVLEMSNVNLASEFTNMIVTQRGFQANSRIISVSDEMLQELANLK